jgi:hypothetical protein
MLSAVLSPLYSRGSKHNNLTELRKQWEGDMPVVCINEKRNHLLVVLRDTVRDNAPHHGARKEKS